MRIFTDKERIAIAKAFLRFMAHMDGRRATAKTYQKLTDKAIDSGLSLDAIFNPANYTRVAEISPANAEMYIESLIERQVAATCITDEPEWSSIEHGFDAVAESFHDFFQDICPRGGTWNTPSAKANLAKAIEAHGLQPIMSESLIISSYGEDGSITCFNYILELIKNADSFVINKDFTEAQETRLAEEKALSIETDEETINDPVETEEKPDDDENLPPNGLRLKNELEEGEETPADAGEEEVLQEQEESAGLAEEPEYSGVATAINVSSSPIQMKRSAITEVISGLSPKELLTFSENAPEAGTIADFVDLLAKGEVSFNESPSPESTMIRQKVNIELIPYFVNCIKLQGMPMDDRNAAELDILAASWDLRDEHTRILQKLNYFIASNEETSDDPDLRKAVRDLEKYYNEK